jgi:hypothetical protein
VLKVTKAFTDAAGGHEFLCKKTGNNLTISLRPDRRQQWRLAGEVNTGSA